MRLVKDPYSFFSNVQPVGGDEIHIHNITPDTYSGKFSPNRRQEILDYCKKNSGYHIATSVDFLTTINRFSDEAIWYYICYGDNDPNFVYFAEHTLIHIKKSQRLHKLWEEKLSTISEKFIISLGL